MVFGVADDNVPMRESPKNPRSRSGSRKSQSIIEQSYNENLDLLLGNFSLGGTLADLVYDFDCY